MQSKPLVKIGSKDLALFIYGAALRILSPTPQTWGSGGLKCIRESIKAAEGRDYEGVVLRPVESREDVEIGAAYMSLEIHGRALLKNIFRITRVRPLPTDPKSGDFVYSVSLWPYPPGAEGCFGLSVMTSLDHSLVLRYEGPVPDPCKTYTPFEQIWRLAKDLEAMYFPLAYLTHPRGEDLHWFKCAETASTYFTHYYPNLLKPVEAERTLKLVRFGEMPPALSQIWDPRNKIDRVSPMLKAMQGMVLNMLDLELARSGRWRVLLPGHACGLPHYLRLVFDHCYERDGRLKSDDLAWRVELIGKLLPETRDDICRQTLLDIQERLSAY